MQISGGRRCARSLLPTGLRRIADAEGWPSRDILMGSFHSALRNLARQQYPEGCYDEWYKGERGFAATAFTTPAYGSAGALLGDGISAEDRDVVTRTLDRAAHWLSRREDLVETNHEIVAATALAAVWKLTGEGGGDMRRRISSMPPSPTGPTRAGFWNWGSRSGYGHLISTS